MNSRRSVTRLRARIHSSEWWATMCVIPRASPQWTTGPRAEGPTVVRSNGRRARGPSAGVRGEAITRVVDPDASTGDPIRVQTDEVLTFAGCPRLQRQRRKPPAFHGIG